MRSSPRKAAGSATGPVMSVAPVASWVIVIPSNQARQSALSWPFTLIWETADWPRVALRDRFPHGAGPASDDAQRSIAAHALEHLHDSTRR
ncbi:hypothetical protein HC891_16585 [Candidatus Gracilibacteria bacterium]|nr:hypothetical protein [Candidatus Gracilibacteria bacterium]